MVSSFVELEGGKLSVGPKGFFTGYVGLLMLLTLFALVGWIVYAGISKSKRQGGPRTGRRKDPALLTDAEILLAFGSSKKKKKAMRRKKTSTQLPSKDPSGTTSPQIVTPSSPINAALPYTGIAEVGGRSVFPRLVDFEWEHVEEWERMEKEDQLSNEIDKEEQYAESDNESLGKRITPEKDEHTGGKEKMGLSTTLPDQQECSYGDVVCSLDGNEHVFTNPIDDYRQNAIINTSSGGSVGGTTMLSPHYYLFSATGECIQPGSEDLSRGAAGDAGRNPSQQSFMLLEPSLQAVLPVHSSGATAYTSTPPPPAIPATNSDMGFASSLPHATFALPSHYIAQYFQVWPPLSRVTEGSINTSFTPHHEMPLSGGLFIPPSTTHPTFQAPIPFSHDIVSSHLSMDSVAAAPHFWTTSEQQSPFPPDTEMVGDWWRRAPCFRPPTCPIPSELPAPPSRLSQAQGSSSFPTSALPCLSPPSVLRQSEPREGWNDDEKESSYYDTTTGLLYENSENSPQAYVHNSSNGSLTLLSQRFSPCAAAPLCSGPPTPARGHREEMIPDVDSNTNSDSNINASSDTHDTSMDINDNLSNEVIRSNDYTIISNKNTDNFMNYTSTSGNPTTMMTTTAIDTSGVTCPCPAGTNIGSVGIVLDDVDKDISDHEDVVKSTSSPRLSLTTDSSSLIHGSEGRRLSLPYPTYMCSSNSISSSSDTGADDTSNNGCEGMTDNRMNLHRDDIVGEDITHDMSSSYTNRTYACPPLPLASSLSLASSTSSLSRSRCYSHDFGCGLSSPLRLRTFSVVLSKELVYDKNVNGNSYNIEEKSVRITDQKAIGRPLETNSTPHTPLASSPSGLCKLYIVSGRKKQKVETTTTGTEKNRKDDNQNNQSYSEVRGHQECGYPGGSPSRLRGRRRWADMFEEAEDYFR